MERQDEKTGETKTTARKDMKYLDKFKVEHGKFETITDEEFRELTLEAIQYYGKDKKWVFVKDDRITTLDRYCKQPKSMSKLCFMENDYYVGIIYRYQENHVWLYNHNISTAAICAKQLKGSYEAIRYSTLLRDNNIKKLQERI